MAINIISAQCNGGFVFTAYYVTVVYYCYHV